MELTRSREMVEGMLKNVDNLVRQGAMARIAQGGKPLTEAQQASLDRIVRRSTELLRSELRWESLEPEYIALYTDTFDQDEIDGIIAFYRTPTGQALIAKMPVVMQKSVALSQARLQAMMPKIMARPTHIRP